MRATLGYATNRARLVQLRSLKFVVASQLGPAGGIFARILALIWLKRLQARCANNSLSLGKNRAIITHHNLKGEMHL